MAGGLCICDIAQKEMPPAQRPMENSFFRMRHPRLYPVSDAPSAKASFNFNPWSSQLYLSETQTHCIPNDLFLQPGKLTEKSKEQVFLSELPWLYRKFDGLDLSLLFRISRTKYRFALALSVFSSSDSGIAYALFKAFRSFIESSFVWSAPFTFISFQEWQNPYPSIRMGHFGDYFLPFAFIVSSSIRIYFKNLNPNRMSSVSSVRIFSFDASSTSKWSRNLLLKINLRNRSMS